MRAILWFRRDLRIDDNSLLGDGGDVLPIFIFDTNILNKLAKDDVRVSFIFDQVVALKASLKNIGLDLALFFGDPIDVFDYLLALGFDKVIASGDYDSYAKARDKAISHKLPFSYRYDTYMFKPHEILKKDGTFYEVFTPFYKQALKVYQPSKPKTPSASMHLIDFDYKGIFDVSIFKKIPLTLESMGFIYKNHGIKPVDKLLQAFEKNLPFYASLRDQVDITVTSQLSVHLRFGTLGMRTLLAWLDNQADDSNRQAFFRQLIFRDFYAYILFHAPHVEDTNFKYTHIDMPIDEEKYQAFITAQTGVPLIDAAIKELKTTHTMHNRMRMVVASFFTKHLLLPWQLGEAFFAQYLLDFDTASNVLSWQWSASTGVDAQPYFRVFNPYTQSKKFDKEAHYIKKYLPQLQAIDAKHLHDEAYLLTHDIPNYPKPIVVHAKARQKAIDMFAK